MVVLLWLSGSCYDLDSLLQFTLFLGFNMLKKFLLVLARLRSLLVVPWRQGKLGRVSIRVRLKITIVLICLLPIKALNVVIFPLMRCLVLSLKIN